MTSFNNIINVIITEITDRLNPNKLEKSMFVTKEECVIYKIRGNYQSVLDSLIKQYGHNNIEVNELNESDSLEFINKIYNLDATTTCN